MSNNLYKNIPIVSAKEIGVNGLSLKPLEIEHKDGNVSTKELSIICGLVVLHKPLNILEIGTFDGRTTVNLAHFSPSAAKVYTIDLPKEDMNSTKYPLYMGDASVGSDMIYINKEESGARYKGRKESKKIIQLYGDTATFDFSRFVGQIDFIFIDGSHAKDYVKNDSELAFRLLDAGNGVILWHDYGVWKDVTDVLNSYFANDVRFRDCKNIKDTSLIYLGKWNLKCRKKI